MNPLQGLKPYFNLIYYNNNSPTGNSTSMRQDRRMNYCNTIRPITKEPRSGSIIL